MTRTDDIPNGWAASPLGAIRADRSSSVDPSKSPSEYFELYSIPAFPSGHPEIIKGEEIGSTKKTLAPGTIVVSKINPHINRVWVVGEHSQHRQIGSSEWIPFFPVGGVEPKYLAYYMRQDAFRNYLAENVSGVGGSLMRVRPATVDPYPIVIAPEDEQHRIVEAIESYLTRLDDAVTTLERVQRNLTRYRASVLKAAVEGRLVPTEAALARAEGRDYEPASVLLERILVERRLRWEAAELAKMTAKGKTPRDDTWKAKYKEPVAPDTADLPELPEGWCWATVDMLAHEVRYGSSAKCSKEAGVPVLRMGNIIDGRLDFRSLKYLPADHNEFPELLLAHGDLVFNRTNSAELVGKSAVFKTYSSPVSFASYLIRVRFCDGVEQDFVAAYINSHWGRRWIASVVTQQVGQANVNGTKLRHCTVPVPPKREQGRIIEETKRLQSVIEVSIQAVATEAARCARLRQAILKWAFEGKLVDQNPDDEPASVLLERIKSEHEAVSASTKTKKRGRGKARST